jgi:hypothetical protein
MKKTIIVLALCLLAVGGAFADFALGLTGALYMDDAQWHAATGRSIAEAFRDGEGIYYGLMGEFMGKHLGFGLEFVSSFYSSYFSVPMYDIDASMYLAGHLLGSRFVIDPTLEVGLGAIWSDYQGGFDDDADNPVSGTIYWDLGAGVGLNIWRLGIYTKFIYHMPIRSMRGSGPLYGETLEAFPLPPYKVQIGAKLIFG